MSEENIDSKKMAISLFQSGDLAAAESMCERLLEMDTENADLWGLLATIHTRTQQVLPAAAAARKAINLSPDYAQAHCVLGWADQEMQNHAEAVEHFRRSLQLQPALINALFLSGRSLLALNRVQQALEAYEAVLQQQPENVDAMCALAGIYEDVHEHEKSSAILIQALAIAPSHAAANLALAIQQRRSGNLNGARAQLEKTLRMDIPGHFRANVANELGLVLDRLGRYQEAFKAFSASQQASANIYQGQFDSDDIYVGIEQRIQLLSSLHIEDWSKQIPNDGLPDPVFIIGFPRSGTTLTEQIIISHSRFVSSDEAPLLADTIKFIPEIAGSGIHYPDCLDSLTPDVIIALRKHYWGVVNTSFELPKGTRFVDKLPLNLAEVALIYRLFPAAPVVYIQRDPRDACLSCFFQLFKLNQGMSQFTRLESTVRFYGAIMALWQAYKEALPLKLFEVRYESLVTDMESVSRNLIEFLREPWEKGVLDFHLTSRKRHITTPSARDVATPIYSRAAGRWKNYQEQMAPVMDELESYAQQRGYMDPLI